MFTIREPGGWEKERMRVLGVIPARLQSTRLPRKVLRTIAGRPMLAWVVEAARRCPELDRVVVATDSAEVMEVCAAHGWPAMLTSAELQSGTDRVEAVAREMEAEIYVNIQGDEPLFRPEHVRALLRPFGRKGVEIATLKVRCSAEAVGNPHAVKVVTAADGRAMYFSRAAIPFDRDGAGATYWKHLGLYAYRGEALRRFRGLAPSELELTERLEQLRFLENGFSVYVEAVEEDTVGVDTEADLWAAEAELLRRLRG